jgi:hypothetical protein
MPGERGIVALARFAFHGPVPPLDDDEFLVCVGCGVTYTAVEIDAFWEELWSDEHSRTQCLNCSADDSNSGFKGFVRRRSSRGRARETLMQRWGAAGKRFVAVPHALLDFAPELELDAYDLAILIAIERHRVGPEGEAFPGVRRLARLAGCSTRTVQSRVQRLEERHLLTRTTRRRSDGAQSSNRYELTGLYTRVGGLAAARDSASAKRQLGARRQRRPGAPPAHQEREEG